MLPASSFAFEYTSKGPLTLRSQNPVYLEFLNLEPTTATVIPEGTLWARIDNAYSNIYEEGHGANNSELLDMELLRTAIHLNYGVYENMEVGIEIPFIRHDSGFLDGFIQKYHNFFGFPNGGRDHVGNNEFHYYFTQGGSRMYNVNQQAFGIGDITFSFKHNFIHEEENVPAVAWLFYFKFPTGDCANGMGSGNPDIGFATALQKTFDRWHTFLNLGYFVNGGHDYLQNYLNDVYFSYVLGGEYSVSHPVSLVAQINGGTPLLADAGFIQWDSFPMDLQLGAKGEHIVTWGPVYALTWQGAFTEDLNPNGPSIDFTVFGSIGFKFDL